MSTHFQHPAASCFVVAAKDSCEQNKLRPYSAVS